MHRVGKVLVLLLVLGVVATAHCAEACRFLQPAAPDCPQHPNSGSTDCCQHSYSDATMTARVILVFLPVPSINLSDVLSPGASSDERNVLPDSVPPYYARIAPSVLRV